ncbi:AarF/ABC1/UbiB kinase family protein [Labedella populi]|uniref:AarF/ABC1/UbiB kinase family protein n=1 Tax=Labedella populi TaxID=2498850 RepID=A0A3S4A1E4_9MICO|nr:AarF/ABC1/UbiB kinase family protein [Labedella populi]
MPWESVRSIVVEELGDEPDDVFDAFDPEPLASASIGQVHTAVLHDGSAVVVKVRRPEAVQRVHEDLEILRVLAEGASRVSDLAAGFDVRGLVREFSDTLLAELDYLREARNAERLAHNFRARSDVLVPSVSSATTTSRVLTLERLGGIKVDDIAALEAEGIDRRALARRGAGIVLQMIFDDRFLHGDLQPGNLFIQPDGSVALIDFGMVGEISEDLRDDLAGFLVAFASGEAGALADAVIDLSVAAAPVDRAEVRAAMAGFVEEYAGRSLGEIHFSHLAAILFGILRRHRLRLPRETALVFRVLVMVEGIGLRLDADFDLFSVIEPYARRLAMERFALGSLLRRAVGATADAGELALELPGALRRLLAEVDRDGLQFRIRAAELEPLVERAERIGNRLVAGMITAALIGGVGRLTTEGRRWRSWQDALMGTGVTITSVLTGYLLWTARRRGSDGKRRR